MDIGHNFLHRIPSNMSGKQQELADEIASNYKASAEQRKQFPEGKTTHRMGENLSSNLSDKLLISRI
jgi:hypothetical protein